MAKISKKKKNWLKEFDKEKKYTLSEAIQLIKKLVSAKFKESVDISFRLGIDPRKSDQIVRGNCILPHGTGKKIRVIAFTKAEKEKEAQEAGADYVGGKELIEKVKNGWFEFDRVVASLDMMAEVGKIGSVLGPRGMMPNPKLGTVTNNLDGIIKSIKQGQIEFRNDKLANLHALIGKIDFTEEQLKENALQIVEVVTKLKPATSKGIYLQKLSISSTMGPGIAIDPHNLV